MSTTITGTIRRLKWVQPSPTIPLWVADVGSGRYYRVGVCLNDQYWMQTEAGEMEEMTLHSALEAAQAVAQEQWEAFIRGAIEPPKPWIALPIPDDMSLTHFRQTPPPIPPQPTLGTYTKARLIAELWDLDMPKQWIETTVAGIEANGGRFYFTNYTSERGIICWCPKCDRIRFNNGPDSHAYACRTCGTLTGGGNMA